MELEPFPPIPASHAHRIVLSGTGARWTAWVPTLPGCMGEGRTRMEALVQVRRAIPRALRARAARAHS